MTRLFFALLLTTIGLTGCLPMDFLREKPKPPPVKVVAPPPPIVTAEQVNEKNAPDCAKGLLKEMEYEKTHRTGSPRE